MKEKERKVQREKHEASPRSLVPIFNKNEFFFLQSLVSGIYATLQIQFTKISKENHYYIGTNFEEIKKSTKKKNQQEQPNSQGLQNFARVAKFRKSCKISQPFLNCQGCLISSVHCFSSSLLPIFDLQL